MSLQFYSDIPNDDWLRNKQSYANESYHRNKGISGSVTGSFSHTVKLPVVAIMRLPGLMDEHEYRNDPDTPKMKSLEKSVKDSGKFDSKNNPIFITVNHKGEAFVNEGNHRLAYAAKHGIQDIQAEVKYYNGGELSASGALHPDYIKKYNRQSITESFDNGNKGSFSLKPNKLIESIQLLSFKEFLLEGFDFKPKGYSETEKSKRPISDVVHIQF